MSCSLTHRARLMVCGALAVTALAPTSVWAQSESAGGGLEEIVVTAQKREQSLQDVPVAVTAVTQETLQVNRVTNIMDLNGLAPGLIARANAGGTGSPSYTMRGIFASGSDPAQDREVATYIDGVYIGGIRGVIFELPDIQRVEVLRGPQGTLFGRNATAGAVSITTRDPAGEFKGRIEGSIGEHASRRGRITIDTPKLGIFSAFATYVHDERRGDIRNLGAGTVLDFTSPFHNIIGKTASPLWLGSKDSDSVFAAVKAEPSDAFSITYKFDWSRNNNTPEGRVPLFNSSPFFTGLIALQGTDTTYGGYVMPAASSNPQRPDTVNNAFAAPSFVRGSGHNVTIKWAPAENISVKNVASWRRTEALAISSIMGLDGLTVTPGIIAAFGAAAGYPASSAGQMIVGYEGINYGKYHQFSDELQLNYNSKLATLTAGAIYFKSNDLISGLPGGPTNYGIFVGNPSFNNQVPFPLGNVQEKHQTTESYAAYLQAEFHVTPQFDLVLGGRVTHDNKSQTFVRGGTYSAASNSIVGTSSVTTPFSKTKPTFAIGVNYKVTPDVLVYAKYSTAYLSGGASGPLVFQPENVKSWEAGLKSEWLDHKVRFNLALYAANYDNLQSAQSGSVVIDPACDPANSGVPTRCTAYGVVVISNGPVHSRGFEAEATVAPAAGLTLGGSLAYNHTTWLNPTTALTHGRPVAPNAIPAWTANFNAQYVTPKLFGDSTLMFRLDGNYQSKYRNSPFTDIATNTTDPSSTVPIQATWEYTPARWLLNGRIALRNIKVGPANAEIAVWARNLTNNKDSTYLLMFASANVNTSFQQARTIGADLIINF